MSNYVSRMGKTIQIISLFVSDIRRPNLVVAYACSSSVIFLPFIIFDSPTVAIMQWRNEIEAHTNGIKVLVWHGASRESDMEQLKKHDVVCSNPLLRYVKDQSIRFLGFDDLFHTRKVAVFTLLFSGL